MDVVVAAVVTKATATLAEVVVATAAELEAVKDHAAVVVAVAAEVAVVPVAIGVRQDVN